MKKILISTLVIIITSIVSLAECTTNGCYGVTVDKIFVTNTGTVYVDTSGDESTLTCGPLGGTYIILPTGVAQNLMYSMLLAAQTTKRKINIKVDIGTYCPISYMY